MLSAAVQDVCTSAADDASYRALHDAALALDGLSASRVIGGHMVRLLHLAFPTDSGIARRTVDADVAVSTEIAAGNEVHRRLLTLGYQAVAGNRYVCGDRVIDLLVPSQRGHFATEFLGERAFDAVPGLLLDPAVVHVMLTVRVLMRDGTTETTVVRVPTVEQAVFLKANALVLRSELKDIQDLFTLLNIANVYADDEIGGWRLSIPGVLGRRGDVQQILYGLVGSAGWRRRLEGAGIPGALFEALIRSRVAAPSPSSAATIPEED
ncbi:hypothetical protein M2390_000416 [Mycetocola sp. BIGb0189]|uniref:hypothetical protein n=1 Tax=Mycetocola sp. BIGb0189 TaxID=2940604 RepID=UPI0021699819|nr:hypothetical protein [Mycetocola sp. BIGb0189]MCS4275258.1 hypothetical protein [Mycetocola sp. BIGb0189]